MILRRFATTLAPVVVDAARSARDEFDAPDFRSIAKRAATDALKGISSYKPSGDSYATADYSNVPTVNTSGAPSVPSGYGEFQGIIDNLKSTYDFGGPKG